MQVDQRQHKIIENIVTLHETGRINNKSYGTVVNVRGDPGGLTYGKHQVTINSGGLYLMLRRYCNTPGARFASALEGWLVPIRAKNSAVVASASLRDILTRAGIEDPVMAQVQDQYFEDQYWAPAVKFCELARGLHSALAMAVVYDSTIHGSLYRINKRVPSNVNEETWLSGYITARRNWMATHPTIPLLRRTTYRMDTFKRLLDARNFDLQSPVWAHGKRADVGLENVDVASIPVTQEPSVADVPPVGLATAQRILDMGDRGEDVKELQQMLFRIGYKTVTADGIFGRNTYDAVVAFQKIYGLSVDGIVGPTTWRVLDQADD